MPWPVRHALGSTQTDSYPTGYGFSDENAPNAKLRAPFTQVLIQGRGVVTHVLVAPLPISILMCEMGLLATIGAVGILLIALVKRVKPPFGSNKDSFRTVSS